MKAAIRCRIFPGSMSAALVVMDLFGRDRVDAGSWPGPVYVNDVTVDELSIARELLAMVDLHIEAE